MPWAWIPEASPLWRCFWERPPLWTPSEAPGTGILLTRFSPRAVLSREVAGLAEELAREMGSKVFRAKIREAVAVKEAQISRMSLFSYAPHAKVADDYRRFVGEILGEV